MPCALMFESNNDRELIYGADKDLTVEDDLLMEDDPSIGRAHPIVAKFDMLVDEASTLLFLGAWLTSLGATLILLNLCQSHDISSLFIS